MDVQKFFRWRVVVNELPLNESLCDDMTGGRGLGKGSGEKGEC